MVACAHAQVEIVELLLSQDKEGETLNFRNIVGNSAMDLAVQMKRTVVIERLESFSEDLRKKGKTLFLCLVLLCHFHCG